MNILRKYIVFLFAIAMWFLSFTSANAQTTFTSGVQTSTATTAILWFQPAIATSWVDAHYNAGGAPQNVRMTFNSTANRFEQLINASAGTTVNYSFTYNLNGPSYDTTQLSAVVGGPTSTSAASSSAPSSVAVASSSSGESATNGVVDNGSSLVIWFKPTSGAAWADAHYNTNSTGQQNVRATLNASNGRFEQIIVVAVGAPVSMSYSFTYMSPLGAFDTSIFNFVRGISSSSDIPKSSASSIASSLVSSVRSSVTPSSAGSSAHSVMVPSSSTSSSSSAISASNGVIDNGSSVIVWYKPASGASWADVHYNINSTGQQNIRATLNATNGRFEQTVPVTAGAALSISYSFTYMSPVGALDSSVFNFLRLGGSSASNTSNSSASKSSCAIDCFTHGVVDSGKGTIATLWFKSSVTQSRAVILHYAIGAGDQTNPQMGLNTSLDRWETKVSPATCGVSLSYFFTYLDSKGLEQKSATFDYTFCGFINPISQPEFSPKPGIYFTEQDVTLSTTQQNGVIHYTTDNSPATSLSPVYVPGTKIHVSNAMLIKAITFIGIQPADGISTSAMSDGAYSITKSGSLSAPTFSYESGTYHTIIRVALASDTAGAVIRYTLDGSTPTIDSLRYGAPIEVKIDQGKSPANSTHIKAIAVKDGWGASAVSEATYTITSNTKSEWNGLTTFNVVNGTHGKYPDNQVYWAIIGKDWNTDQFVHVDLDTGALIPMAQSDNVIPKKGGIYANYFRSLAQSKKVTIPAINSARILMSVGSPMYIWVNRDINGKIGYAGANIENPDDANMDVTFDFGEFAIVPKGRDYQGIFVNTTRVDTFGFPVQLSVTGLDGFTQTVGDPLVETSSQLFARFIAETPAEFSSLAQEPNAPYRIAAPGHSTFQKGFANEHYLDDYISQVWEQYRHQPLTLDLHNLWPVFTGRVEGDRFIFTNSEGSYAISRKPTTKEVMLGNGVLDQDDGLADEPRARQLQLQAQMCAALNRRVAHLNGDKWHDFASFYPVGQPANYFAKFWHDHSLNGLAYGFSYDDVGSYSPSIFTWSPVTVTYTIGE